MKSATAIEKDARCGQARAELDSLPHARRRLHAKLELRAAARGLFDSARRTSWIEHWPVAVIALLACVLRAHQITRRLVIFDEFLLANPFRLPEGPVAYTRGVWATTTYNPGWAIVVWLMNRVGGLSTCRVPSCVAGTLTPVAVYFAARGMRLSRNAGLFAASVIAFGVYQIEYGQQVIPYAAMPLVGAVCVGLVTLLARSDDRARPARRALLWLGFVITATVATFIHNSALLLFPPVFLYWAWSTVWPSPIPTGDDGYRRRSAYLLFAALVVVSATSFPWLYAKIGEADRNYLRPFYASTFRDAPIRWFASDLLNETDALYSAQRPKLGGYASAADAAYFASTRILDLPSTYLRAEYLTGDQRPFGSSAGKLPWVYTIGMLLATAAGMLRAVRGRCNPAAARWSVCFAFTLALGVVLSALRIFPIGGVRQWLCLSPLLAVTAALAVDSANRLVSRAVLALGALWLAGNIQLLPHYYETTLDTVPSNLLIRYAHNHGIQHFVCADGLPSLGPLARVTAEDASLHMFRPSHPGFNRVTDDQAPFLMCSLSGPPLTTLQAEPALRPEIDTKRLANYIAIPLIQPPQSKRWFSWDIVLYKPDRPQVERIEVRRDETNRSARPAFAIVVSFSKPMNSQSVNTKSVHLTGLTPRHTFDAAGSLPLDVSVSGNARTLVARPATTLAVGRPYLLTLNRSMSDTAGASLDIDRWERHTVICIDDPGTDTEVPEYRLLEMNPADETGRNRLSAVDRAATGEGQAAKR